MLSTLIISDLHLTNVELDKVKLFENFCNEHASKVDQLFILGDLFNSWIGDDASLASYKVITSILKDLSEKTNVFVMVGNRDFLLSKNFEKESGCQLIKEPFELVSCPQYEPKKAVVYAADSAGVANVYPGSACSQVKPRFSPV